MLPETLWVSNLVDRGLTFVAEPHKVSASIFSVHIMTAFFQHLLDGMLTLLFPPRCAVCGLLQEPLICPQCTEGITCIAAPCCAQCGVPFPPQAQALSHCAACRDDPPPFDAARAAGIYGGALRQAIHAFKYDGMQALASPLGVFMRDHITLPFPVACLSPVPLHPERLAMRGYNQSQLLAEELGTHWNVPVHSELLRRILNTTPQMQLPPDARRKNIKGAFATRAVPLPPTVGLVDDVFTTGSTLRECSRILKRAGVERVLVLTLARTAPEFEGPGVAGTSV